MEEQTRHFRLEDKVYTELKVRAARKNIKVGEIIKELVFPKKS